MIDGRFDPAFHQAFVASDAQAVDLPVPPLGLATILLASFGAIALLCAALRA